MIPAEMFQLSDAATDVIRRKVQDLLKATRSIVISETPKLSSDHSVESTISMLAGALITETLRLGMTDDPKIPPRAIGLGVGSIAAQTGAGLKDVVIDACCSGLELGHNTGVMLIQEANAAVKN